MTTCSTCNHSITAQANFCPNCGISLKKSDLTSTSTPQSIPEKITSQNSNYQNITAISEGLQKVILPEIQVVLSTNLFDAFKLPYQALEANANESTPLAKKNDELQEEIARLTADNSDQKKLDLLIKEYEVTQYQMQELLLQLISQQQISSIKKSIEFGIISISDWPVQTLQKIFNSHLIPIHPSLRNHFPTEAQCHTETMQIQVGIRKQLTEFLYELNELQILQQKLENLIPHLKRIWNQDNNTDWGDIAKYAGAGAMAVINPLIGIPLLAGKFFSDSKQTENKQEVQKDILDQWDKFFDQYAEKWDQLSDILSALQENLTLYVHEKIVKIVVGGTIHLLHIADKQGEQIQAPSHYFGLK